MYLPPIIELAYLGVADAGVPNQERIVLRPTQKIDLAQCAVVLGLNQGEQPTVLYPDIFFWFGGPVVQPPSWIFLYTGSGQYTETKTVQGGEKAHVFHWGKPQTLFNHQKLLPVILRFDAVLMSRLKADEAGLPTLWSDFNKLLGPLGGGSDFS